MGRTKSFLSILIPSATVFISSACIMILEIVAGRLIARYLGSSLYTWTSVIGVVLAGITVGNYLGGRIADRFVAKRALALLFGISSAACILVVILNNLVGEWIWLWHFSWPVRVFSHVALIFLIPSTLLGTISPVVAKMALDRGLSTGRTVGDIYAWGAAGSILGTFIAGFYLIAAMGTIAIIWTVAAVLLLMAVLYWARLWVLYLWAVVFAALMAMGFSPAGWAGNAGAALGLRQQPDPSILYEDESQYFYIAVKRLPEKTDKYAFVQDKYVHSEMIIDDPRDLQSFYARIYAAVTHRLSAGKSTLSTLTIGGGGYVFPRYIEAVWPGSRVDVAEIDPGVTAAATRAFGLPADTAINTINADARNYVDELIQRQSSGEKIPRYDFVYGDAYKDLSAPYHLVTKQFNDKIYAILDDDGVYMANIIDMYDRGRFLSAFVTTLRQTFPDVYVLSELAPHDVAVNFVVVAAKRQIDLKNLDFERPLKGLGLWMLSDSEIESLRKKTGEMVLTDNYCPVENLLAPAVRREAICSVAKKYLQLAEELREKGKLQQAVSRYKDVIRLEPDMSIKAYNEIGRILTMQGMWRQAVEAAECAIEYNAASPLRQSMANIHYNMSLALRKLGRDAEAAEHLGKAIEEYRRDLAGEPDSPQLIALLGNALAESGDFRQASDCFQKAVSMDPFDRKNRLMLAQALVIQGRYDEAVEQLRGGIRFMSEQGRQADADELNKYLQFIEGSSTGKK
jgi:spermidine synthase/Tfp pilus assembly protein PilF